MASTVLIVEDHPWFCETSARAIRACNDLVLVSDIAQARTLMAEHEPDVLLVDRGPPSGREIDLVRCADERLPQCSCIVISVFGDDESVPRCIQAGATGYLMKDARDVYSVEQIKTLRGGGSPIGPIIAHQMLRLLSSALAEALQAHLIWITDANVATIG